MEKVYLTLHNWKQRENNQFLLSNDLTNSTLAMVGITLDSTFYDSQGS